MSRGSPVVRCATSALVGAALLARSAIAFAGPEDTPPVELERERYELAGFPIVGGNSDIGVQFGGAATLTRFEDGVRPYFWNADLLLSASIKSDQNGLRMVQQSHVLRLDMPSVLAARARLDTKLSFQRTINAEYFGIGNATTSALVPGESTLGRRYQYVHQEGRLRAIGRVHTGTPVDIAMGANFRYEAPGVMSGTKLAEDVATSTVRGSRSAGLVGLAAGLMYDTRDSEFVTARGAFYQLGIGGTVGSAEGIHYGDTSAVLSHFAPIGGPFIFASRFVASFEFGNVPFYDLAQGGTFEPQYLLGGETGIRGVPQGRYAGLVKVISNVEIRAPLPRFRLFGQRFRFGTTTFFDAGRVWSGYAFDPIRDGNKLGLKYGIGAGAFLQWGEAAIFRIEAAYSPDAVSENPGFPVGIYVADGLMF
jgi:outer membrane protein assembly factor BamA